MSPIAKVRPLIERTSVLRLARGTVGRVGVRELESPAVEDGRGAGAADLDGPARAQRLAVLAGGARHAVGARSRSVPQLPVRRWVVPVSPFVPTLIDAQQTAPVGQELAPHPAGNTRRAGALGLARRRRGAAASPAADVRWVADARVGSGAADERIARDRSAPAAAAAAAARRAAAAARATAAAARASAARAAVAASAARAAAAGATIVHAGRVRTRSAARPNHEGGADDQKTKSSRVCHDRPSSSRNSHEMLPTRRKCFQTSGRTGERPSQCVGCAHPARSRSQTKPDEKGSRNHRRMRPARELNPFPRIVRQSRHVLAAVPRASCRRPAHAHEQPSTRRRAGRRAQGRVDAGRDTRADPSPRTVLRGDRRSPRRRGSRTAAAPRGSRRTTASPARSG